MIRPIQTRSQPVDVDFQLSVACGQDQVVTLAIVGVAPNHSLRKDLEKGSHLALHYLRGRLIKWDPLGDGPSWIQASRRQFEVLLGVESGRTLHPWMDGIGGDEVEGLVGREEEVAPVVVDQLHPGVIQYIVVELGEKL